MAGYLRFNRRRRYGRAFVSVSRSGPRVGMRSRRGSASVGATGPSLSVRLARGLSYVLRGK